MSQALQSDVIAMSNADCRASTYGQDMIKMFEGCVLEPYQDTAGFWTAGWGHRIASPKMPVVTMYDAVTWFRNDIEAAVIPLRKGVTHKLTPSQVDALASWIFNLGVNRFRASDIWRKLNAGQIIEAAQEMRLYDLAGGKVEQGLVKRRAWEYVQMTKDT